jgi:hypothetical protein
MADDWRPGDRITLTFEDDAPKIGGQVTATVTRAADFIDDRDRPLDARIKDGVLMVSIGLDALADLRKRLGIGAGIGDGDIADFLVNAVDGNEGNEGGHTPFEGALRLAWHRAKLHESNRVEREPDREFWR